ncbi:hypothetical protein TWF730_006053 [Orbilia blumenaviensis]|uniref:Uncharacterized protein n=1 Tax=Orbilia blumenaviensis TaxID=1796055 RepID=A0AAV9VKD8_9PEZI
MSQPDDVAFRAKHDPALALPLDEKHEHTTAQVPPVYDGHDKNHGAFEREEEDAPTEEEIRTLRHVSDKIPWNAYTVAFVELCERFSYYGTTVVFTNFIQQSRPEGSRTGAGGHDGQSGALGRGQRASTGLGTFNTFWVYLLPLFGAYVADTYWGRYKTICVAVAVAMVGHVLLVVSAVPTVIDHPDGALGCFAVAIIIMGIGTGGFKANISPLVAEQSKNTYLRVDTLPSGERVIVDPAVTSSRIYMYFYLMINIGALIGQITMVYAEKYVGFWLSFLLPTLVFCLCPVVLFICRKRYVRSPPQGSVLSKAMQTFVFAQKGRWHLNPVQTFKHLNDGTMWETAKPSNITPANRPSWMTFDDAWVDEVRRGFHACSVFVWLPLWWLCYNQINNNLVSQAAVMKLNGLPNDIVNNLDPLALIILIPICDIFIYPALRKAGINFTALKRITFGFYTGAAAMIWACLIQYYIYKHSECGRYAAGKGCEPSDINVWAQTGSYVLIALSEIFASITGLEYAFTKAPKNMRSLVMSVFLFTNAISAAIGEAFVSLSEDPLLVWNYGSVAIIAAVGGTLFWVQFRGLDAQEHELNQLPVGKMFADQDKVEPLTPEEMKHRRESLAETA